MAINPLGPQPGQSPSEVVKGFLDAMQATPIRTDVAREFLAEPAQDVWNPEATVIYDSASLPRPSPVGGDLVDVELDRREPDRRAGVLAGRGQERRPAVQGGRRRTASSGSPVHPTR